MAVHSCFAVAAVCTFIYGSNFAGSTVFASPIILSRNQSEHADKSWLGVWQSTGRTENWDAYVLRLTGKLPAKEEHTDTRIHHLWQDGAKYHHAVMIFRKRGNYRHEVDFKLGQEGHTRQNGVDSTFTYSEDGDKLVLVVKVPSRHLILRDTYKVKGDELVKTYTVNGVQVKRWYKRSNDV